MDFLAQPFRADMSSESQELCFSTTIERTALPKASLYFAQFRFESAVVQTSAYTTKQSFAFELSFSLLISTKTARILFSDGYLPYGEDNGRAQGPETYKFTGNSYSSTMVFTMSFNAGMIILLDDSSLKIPYLDILVILRVS